MQDKRPDPRELYSQRTVAREAEATRLQRRHLLLGYVRLALVAAVVVIAWYSLHLQTISAWWLIPPILLFILVARQHAAVLQHQAECQRALRFFERGLARIDDRWPDLPPRHSAIEPGGSLFAADLDLFRANGLFDLLNTARTSIGEDTLSAWMLEGATRDEILARQEAIAELRGLHSLREDLAVAGKAEFETIDNAAIGAWASAPMPRIPSALRWIAPVLAAVTVGAAVWYLVKDSGLPLLLLVLVGATITFTLQKRTQAYFLSAERLRQSLALASVLIAQWEAQSLTSPLLRDLQATLRTNSDSASRALDRLSLLAGMMEQRGNFLVRVLDGPLLYSVQLALAAQSWRSAHGSSLASWLRTLGELEALQSLATYSFEHPADPFPQIEDEPVHFEAEQLGHPLLPASRCVRNDVALNESTRLLLISGSNMSGKSTLLRAIGVNAVLAMAGAPVRARSLRVSPLRLGASIQVGDSLAEGRSRFYSEILRLRAVCELAEQHPPVLFLLDEILDGTNSSDRLTGVSGIARALLASGAIGLISTHDLALTEIAAADAALRNVHFEEQIVDGEMRFDFLLRDGVVTTRNGVALMRLVGLKV